MNNKIKDSQESDEIIVKLQTEYLAGFYMNTAISRVLYHRTKQSDELNFYIPEKWNYGTDI